MLFKILSYAFAFLAGFMACMCGVMYGLKNGYLEKKG